jgi:hypothetical protein
MSASLASGPGAFDPSFETSSNFTTHTSMLALGLPSSPHRKVQIFYSTNIESVLGAAAFETLPQGTVAIKKQDRDGDGIVDQLMVMIKQPPGTDPAHGDWFWEQHDPSNGMLVTSSETDAGFQGYCSGCHSSFTCTDWLSGTGLRN